MQHDTSASLKKVKQCTYSRQKLLFNPGKRYDGTHSDEFKGDRIHENHKTSKYSTLHITVHFLLLHPHSYFNFL